VLRPLLSMETQKQGMIGADPRRTSKSVLVSSVMFSVAR
jgi:hypothetical protein